MADIDTYLYNIQNATYGEEVRGAIHDSIEAMNEEASEALSAATSADTKADIALENSIEAVSVSESAYDTANEALTKIENARVTRYGVRFGGSANSGATVRRTYDAVGLVAGVGTDTETAINDFDNIYPWAGRRRCCGTWDNAGHFTVNAYEGEPGYTTDGSNGEVWVETPLFYYDHIYDGDAEEITISPYPIAGFKPSPIHINKDGSLRQKAYTAAYPMGIVNGSPTSRSGVEPYRSTHKNLISTAQALGNNYYITSIKEWYVKCILMWVEFATRDIQSVMKGCCQLLSYPNGAKALYTENETNRVIISFAYRDYVDVGVRIRINNSDIRFVTSKEPYSYNSSGVVIEYAIYFTGQESLDIVQNYTVEMIHWVNGSCDGVLSSSGSYKSNSSGLYTCVYRGEESPFGNLNTAICDILYKRVGDGTAEDPYKYVTYFLPDMSHYANFQLNEYYVLINYDICHSYGYTKKIGYDARFPFVRLPISIGGSRTTYYSCRCSYIQTDYNLIRGAALGGDSDTRNDIGIIFHVALDALNTSYLYDPTSRLSYQY